MAEGANFVSIYDESYSSNFLRNLYDSWQAGTYCDISLTVKGVEFRVHKIVLGSLSQYFWNMFTEDFVEKNQSSVVLENIDPDAFHVILNYFYTGYIKVSPSTAEEILRTADYFSLKTVTALCSEYLEKSVNTENCIQRYFFAVQYGLQTLKDVTLNVIKECLATVSATFSFYDLEINSLKDLILAIVDDACAEKIYEAICIWVGDTSRKSHLYELLELVPTDHISYSFYMEKMKNDNLLRQDLKCTTWLLDNFADRFNESANGCSLHQKSIFLTSVNSDASKFYEFKVNCNCLESRSFRPKIIFFSTFHYKNGIYLVAGESNKKNLQKSFRYDVFEKDFFEFELNCNRTNAASCISGDKLYVCGGYDLTSESALNSCLCYDFETGQTTRIADMDEVKELPAIAVYQNSIYVCCGLSEYYTGINFIQRYDPREGEWFKVSNAQHVSNACSSAVISDSLYLSELYTLNIEKFDFRNNNSDKITLPKHKDGGYIASVDSKLFKVYPGGLEQYEPKEKKWFGKRCTFSLDCPIIVPWESS